MVLLVHPKRCRFSGKEKMLVLGVTIISGCTKCNVEKFKLTFGGRKK
ncbi:hypothetical protein ID858_13265 [Xenorhabdus sp. DI]|nr:hypothetical protein [Xenorhabdus sp. 3]MBD2789478.1 hypothetical protein [Xenorhabdus sp. DI]